MEPTAAPRQAAVSIRHHALISDELADQVTGVVSVGRFGLGRHLRRLCSAAPSHIAFSAYGAGADPFGTVNLTLAMESLPDFFRDAESFDATWLRAWRAADAEAAERVAAATHRWADQPTGVHIAREVLAAAHTHDSLVFAAASRSIRDVDLIAGFDGPRVLANLGVNGIDGLLSTAAGVALSAGAPTYALIGDIAFLHGSNGLLWPDDEPQPNLTIVVNDDNGGAIFSDLEQGAQDYAPWFERVFGTPHNRDLVSLARGFGVDAVEVFDLQQLRAELEPHEGIKVVVVVGCDRETSRDFRKSLRKA